MDEYFRCNDCGCEFAEPAQERTGVNYMGCHETWGVCPSCGSGDYDEGCKCAICGEWFDASKATSLCDDCRNQAATLDVAAEYGATLIDGDGLNPLLLYLAVSEYGSEEVNRRLLKSLKHDMLLFHQYGIRNDHIVRHVDDYLSEDYSAFDDWYLEKLKREKNETTGAAAGEQAEKTITGI